MNQQEHEELTGRFHEAMLGQYARARVEMHWRDAGLLDAIRALGGYVTARMLLAWPAPSDGFAMLCAAGRLDLSTEFLVLSSPWRELFTPENLEVARSRLREHHTAVPPEDAAGAAA